MEPSTLTISALAGMIDHSLLPPTLTDHEIADGLALVRRLKTAAVCVKPYSTALAAKELAGSGVAVCAVAAFPHGSSSVAGKVREAELAIEDGATEIDVVSNSGKALSGAWDYVRDEIRAVNEAVTSRGALLKVIFEIDYLSDREIIRLCEICSEVGTAFVKTSTGFGFVKQANGMYQARGATEHAVSLMRQHCARTMRIKAAGGIRTLDDLLRLRECGADRFGTSSTEALLAEARKRGMA